MENRAIQVLIFQEDKDMKYDLHTRHTIPKDYESCWNCRHMQWMVALGQGARCSNKKNEYRVFFRHADQPDGWPNQNPIKMPLIPGVAEKCELFDSRFRKL